MKRTLLIIAAALALAISVSAQENNRRQGQGFQRPDEATMLKMRTERMAKELGLDESQTAKLLELNQKYPGAMRGPGNPGMGRPKGDRQTPPEMTEEQVKEMQAAREAYENELKGILTEEQFKTWKENSNKRPQGRGPRGPRGGFGGEE